METFKQHLVEARSLVGSSYEFVLLEVAMLLKHAHHAGELFKAEGITVKDTKKLKISMLPTFFEKAGVGDDYDKDLLKSKALSNAFLSAFTDGLQGKKLKSLASAGKVK